MSLYEMVLARLNETDCKTLTGLFDLDAIFAYCKAKPGVTELRHSGKKKSEFRWYDSSFVTIEGDFPLPQLQLHCRSSRVDALMNEHKGIHCEYRSEWGKQKTKLWIEVNITPDIQPELLLELIDDAYAIIVEGLSDKDKAILALMDRASIDENKIRQLIHLSDLEHRSNEIFALLKPSISLQPSSKTKRYPGYNRSKFGGLPYLPGAMNWPTYNSIPLSFLAQINLSEISQYPAAIDLPSKGMLYFFSSYGWMRAEMMGDSTIRFESRTKVIYLNSDLEQLTHTRLPPRMPIDSIYPEFGIEFSHKWTLPCSFGFNDPLDPAIKALGWNEDEYNKLSDLTFHLHRLYVDNGEIGHQLMGHFYPESNPIAINPEDRLLMQLTSDYSYTGFEWGDGGNLFFAIDQKDLTEHNFNRIRVEFECG
ncbi:MAG: DUF1963 domain-containing protein [Anaerolineae bacterium]